MPYSFDIRFRRRSENFVSDALSRAHCGAVTNMKELKPLHDSLFHPGVQRMCHIVRSKNLSHSMEEVRRITSACQVCARIKPRFYVPKGDCYFCGDCYSLLDRHVLSIWATYLCSFSLWPIIHVRSCEGIPLEAGCVIESDVLQ